MTLLLVALILANNIYSFIFSSRTPKSTLKWQNNNILQDQLQLQIVDPNPNPNRVFVHPKPSKKKARTFFMQKMLMASAAT